MLIILLALAIAIWLFAVLFLHCWKPFGGKADAAKQADYAARAENYRDGAFYNDGDFMVMGSGAVDPYADRVSQKAVKPAEALPVAVPGLQPVASVDAPQESVSVAGVAAKVSAEGPRTASAIVWEAASAVADVLLVTPSLMRGEGEVVVQLKPDVLDGSRLRIQVTGNEMQIAFEPVSDDVARLLTETQPQLVRHLTERMPAFEFAVTVVAGTVAARREARKPVGRGET